MEAAAVPTPFPLKTKLGKEIKGVEGALVKMFSRIHREDQLFEHPPKTKKSGPLFGTSPPPPALSNQNTRKSLTSSAQNSQIDEGVRSRLGGFDSSIRKNLSQPQGVERQIPDRSAAELHRTYGTAETLKMVLLSQRVSLKLDNLILNAVANIPVISLAELRREMPAEYQGKVFDEAVLRLADEQKVFISRDSDPARFLWKRRQITYRTGTSFSPPSPVELTMIPTGLNNPFTSHSLDHILTCRPVTFRNSMNTPHEVYSSVRPGPAERARHRFARAR